MVDIAGSQTIEAAPASDAPSGAPTAEAKPELDLPEPPLPSSVEGLRLHRKTQLAVALRVFARYGYDDGLAGHITARDPENPNHFWINPWGQHFSRIKVSDLIVMDLDGRTVQGPGRTSKSAFLIHAGVHRLRPDNVCVVHTHSIHGRAWAALGRHLDPIGLEACAFYEDHVVYNDGRGPRPNGTEGERIGRALGAKRALILQNHGLLTVGKSVEEAAWNFISMDRVCQVQLLADAAGTPKPMTHEEAMVAHRQFSSPNAARYNFRMLADLVLEQEPDVLD